MHQPRAVTPLIGAAIAAAACVGHAAQPERIVVGSTVISARDPAVEISLPAAARYLGSDRFVLIDRTLGRFDDCDLYAFIEADGTRHIGKLYWVQFEAYLPSHPDLHHTYDSPRHTTIGGLDFYVDTWVSSRTARPQAGSDAAHFDFLLESRGYRRTDLMSVRLVHLTDASKRKELMIIYSESLAPTGYTAVQLKEGGADHAKWASIEHGLIRRAEQSITIKRSPR